MPPTPGTNDIAADMLSSEPPAVAEEVVTHFMSRLDQQSQVRHARDLSPSEQPLMLPEEVYEIERIPQIEYFS